MNNDSHVAELSSTLALSGDTRLSEYRVFNEFDEARVDAVRRRWGSLADRAVGIVARLGEQGVDISVADLIDLLERCAPPDWNRSAHRDVCERCVDEMLDANVIDSSGTRADGIVFAIAVARVLNGSSTSAAF